MPRTSLLIHLTAAIVLLVTTAAPFDCRSSTASKTTRLLTPATGRRCSAFQYEENGGCHDCPYGGLARTFGGCYDRFEVRRCVACKTHGVCRNDVCDEARDLSRRGSFNSSLWYSSQFVTFYYASFDTRKFVEKILVWKRSGGCTTRQQDYKFTSHFQSTNDDSSDISRCYAKDEGDFLTVTCRRMRAFGLRMRRADGEKLEACDVPAEVEVYGRSDRPAAL